MLPPHAPPRTRGQHDKHCHRRRARQKRSTVVCPRPSYSARRARETASACPPQMWPPVAIRRSSRLCRCALPATSQIHCKSLDQVASPRCSTIVPATSRLNLGVSSSSERSKASCAHPPVHILPFYTRAHNVALTHTRSLSTRFSLSPTPPTPLSSLSLLLVFIFKLSSLSRGLTCEGAGIQAQDEVSTPLRTEHGRERCVDVDTGVSELHVAARVLAVASTRC